jgi:Family of unknown function (DUF6427)
MFMSIHVPLLAGEEGVFYKGLIKFLKPAANSNPLIFPMLAFGLLFVQSLLLNQFINNQRMTNRPTWFPAMAYMLITSLLPEWNYFSAPLIVNTILLYILTALFKTYNQGDVKGRVFNIGLALGVASFFFFPALTFIIWVFLALMVMRPFRLNEWMLCLVGITTPFYFYAVYLFINDSWSWNNLLPHFSVNMPAVKQSMWLAGTAFLLVVPFLAGGYYVQESLRKMLIQVRKGWSLLLLYMLAAVFIPFVNSSGTLENWVIAAIPFAAFHACMYLYSSLRIIPLLIFWLTVAFVIGYQYGGPRW